MAGLKDFEAEFLAAGENRLGIFDSAVVYRTFVITGILRRKLDGVLNRIKAVGN